MKRNTGSFFKQNQKHLWFFSVVLLIVILDQLAKFLIRVNFSLGEAKRVLFFNLTFIQNTGAGFGLFRGGNAWLAVISLLVVGVIIYYYRKIKFEDKSLFFSTALVLAGAVGNLLDRLFLGYVVDFLDFIYWPAFNLADMSVTIGVVGLVIYFWKKK